MSNQFRDRMAHSSDMTVLDVTGQLCPIPVLRTRRVLDDMQEGDKLLVKASDPAAVQDMPAFCKMVGHTLHMARVAGETYLFEIEKKTGSEQTAPSNIIPIRQAN